MFTYKDFTGALVQIHSRIVGSDHVQSSEEIPASAGAFSFVPSAATNTALLTTSTTRVGGRIFNRSAKALLIAFGFTATVDNYSDRIEPYSSVEIPAWARRLAINGIWVDPDTGAASGDGDAAYGAKITVGTAS